MFDCVHALETACGLDCVGAHGLLFKIALHHFTPIYPLFYDLTQNTTRGIAGMKLTSQCAEMNQLSVLVVLHLYNNLLSQQMCCSKNRQAHVWSGTAICINCTCSRPYPAQIYCIQSALLLALFHAGCDPTISTLLNLGTVSAASRDYTKYREEWFSLQTQNVKDHSS